MQWELSHMDASSLQSGSYWNMRKQSHCTRKIYIGYREGFLHGEDGQTLEWALQRSGGVPIPGGI